ncbi:hypothetical protein GCM10027589_57300 [Actinocorallia lasiicapitis]
MTDTFAKILDELCARPVGRRPYTNAELVRLVVAQGGDITDGYISHLRRGHRDNPSLHTVEALASALGVSPAVFVGGRRERHGQEWPRLRFSARLSHLFANVFPAGRGPYTPEEVATAINAARRYGTISPSHIRELLNPAPGTLPNPRLKHILALAEHFGLADENGPQAAYFLDDQLAARIDADLKDERALRDAGVVEFAARLAQHASEWSPALRSQVARAVAEALVSGGEPGWEFPRPGGAR